MTQNTVAREKSGLLKIALMMFGVSALFSTLSELSDSLKGIFLLFTLPGFAFYVLVTGDIHRWQPGPIGHTGRVIVIALGAWIFWTPMVYLIHRRRKGKK